MKGWLAANLFLLGMALFAAAIMFAGTYAIRHLGFDTDTHRAAIGAVAIAAIFGTGLAFRALLRRIERRR